MRACTLSMRVCSCGMDTGMARTQGCHGHRDGMNTEMVWTQRWHGQDTAMTWDTATHRHTTASGASRSRGRRDRRTFEAAEAELLQPGERPARGARARGPGAPDTEAAAHPRRPVSEPPTALKQAASESTLPRDEPIGPPTCSAPWASASVSDAVEQIRPPASRCARPARVHQCQAARPLAPIQCCRRVTQPISSRDGVS